MTVKIKSTIIERFSDGDVIMTEGVMSSKAYIIHKGKVRISKKIGNKAITVVALTEGDIFGEMGLFQQTVRFASAIAVGDVEVGIIDKNRFDELMNQTPADMKELINALIDRLRITTEKATVVGVKWEKARKVLDEVAHVLSRENIN